MNDTSSIFALDGHDAAGKTTLADWLAQTVGGTYQRPFHGRLGADLLNAANHGDVAQVIALGEEGIRNALVAAGVVRPIILDRAWMTVASLISWEDFLPVWHLWIPTVLCWADIETTLDRLGHRTEKPETIETHSYYLGHYRSLAERSGSYVVRTDLNSISQCHDLLIAWFNSNPNTPLPQP